MGPRENHAFQVGELQVRADLRDVPRRLYDMARNPDMSRVWGVLVSDCRRGMRAAFGAAGVVS